MTLDKKSVAAYLKRKKQLEAGEIVLDVRQIGDGQKNLLFLVITNQNRLIVKQAHSRAQIKERWWLDRKRIFNEKNCIDVLGHMAPPDVLPEVMLEDRTDFILVTSAPPADAALWDADLFNGRIDLQIAVQCGDLLAQVHNQTYEARDVKNIFKETKPFQQLRIEPLYGSIAQAFPDLKKPIEALAKQLLRRRHCLVLGDLRPRNIWVNNGQVYLTDFATAHYGNPSFDLAYYSADLCLKAMVNNPQKAAYLEAINVFWTAYFRLVEYPKKEEVERNAIHDFGCLLLSATDGRIPVDYLDDEMRDLARRISQSLLFTELEHIEDITEFINRTLIDG